MNGRPKEAENPLSRFCDAYLGYELRKNLVLRGLATTSPSLFRNIGIFHAVLLLFDLMATPL